MNKKLIAISALVLGSISVSAFAYDHMMSDNGNYGMHHNNASMMHSSMHSQGKHCMTRHGQHHQQMMQHHTQMTQQHNMHMQQHNMHMQNQTMQPMHNTMHSM